MNGLPASNTVPGPELTRRAPMDGRAPLSFAQELLWLIDRASPGTTAWNVPRAFRIFGPLDRSALQRAFDALCERHEVLRTVFAPTDDGPRQVVLPTAPVPIQTVDLSNQAPDERSTRCAELVRRHGQTPFDLSREAPLRVLLLDLGSDERVLCITTHHIVSDGWSKSIMFRELSALYREFARGVPADLPALPIQFGDYAAWERDPLRQASVAASLAYWTERLALMPPLELPVDRAPGDGTRFAGARTVTVLPHTLAEDVRRLARERGVTPYMVLLAAYVTLLHRYSGQRDIAIGSPIAARTESATDGLIGYLANTLVLRCRFEGEPTFAELLALVRDTCLEAYEFAEIPFEQLVLELQKREHLTHAPFFRVILTMEDTVEGALQFDGVSIEPIEVEELTVKADLTLLAADHPDGLRLSLWYRTELFERSSAERLLGHLRTVLESVVADPGQSIGRVGLLTSAERAQLASWNATAVDAEPLPVHEQFVSAAQRVPTATALVCGEERLRYDELASRTARLAARLRELGVERGAAVGLWLDRSSAFVVGLLGTLRAGGAYVPLAPELPLARLEHQIAQSGVRVVVTLERFRASVPAGLTILTLDGELANQPAALGTAVPVGLEEPAYVLFTSGSTGVPKGVVVTHGNLAHYTAAISRRLELAQAGPLQFATVTSPAADLGNTAIFPALCSGGTLYVVDAELAGDPARFGAYVGAAGIDVLKITPSHLRALMEGPAQGAVLPRRWLVLGGEALGWELAERVRTAGACRVLNHYGPTEATVGACTFEVDSSALRASSASVPIGRPLDNVRCYVLDERLEPVPVGVPGELWIAGAGVAQGYIGQPELSAERFVPDPIAGSGRMYRTGDRVRRLAAGELEFLGRLDGQVKVRGFRVELGEIESVLARHRAVGQAAVVVRASDGELAAFVVPAPGAEIEPAQLQGRLAEELPEYMQPASFNVLERLPLTPNGKLDRAALGALASESPPESAFVAPRTPTEAVIAAIWADVLNREQVSVTADFLSLGFHSILAIRALGKLSRSLGVRLPLRALFDAPTIEQLARTVDAEADRLLEVELEETLATVERMSEAEIADALAAQSAGARPT